MAMMAAPEANPQSPGFTHAGIFIGFFFVTL
jgi:hypothetical protein